MRHLPFVACLAGLSISATAVGAAAVDDVGTAPESYIVEATEFKLQASDDADLTAEDVIRSFQALKAEGKLDLVYTVTVAAWPGHEAVARFGHNETVVTASTTTRSGGLNTTYRQIAVGAELRVTASPQDGNVRLQLAYESSGLDVAGEAAAPTHFSSATLVDAKPDGTPVLVSGASTRGTARTRSRRSRRSRQPQAARDGGAGDPAGDEPTGAQVDDIVRAGTYLVVSVRPKVEGNPDAKTRSPSETRRGGSRGAGRRRTPATEPTG